MEFGYFTLSDNHYENNSRTSNQFIADFTDEVHYADKIGMYSQQENRGYERDWRKSKSAP